MCTLPTRACVCTLPLCTCLWGSMLVPVPMQSCYTMYVLRVLETEWTKGSPDTHPPPQPHVCACVHMCLCVLLPVLSLNKVYPLPCKQTPSVSLAAWPFELLFGGLGGWRPPCREDQMVEWTISLPALPVAHPGLWATWGMAGRHPQPWCRKAALTPLALAPPQVAFCPGHINLCPGQLAEAGEQTGQVPRACRQSGCRVTPNSPGPGI